MLLVGIVLLIAGVLMAYAELTGWFGYALSNPDPEEIVGILGLSVVAMIIGFIFIFITLEDAGIVDSV